MDSETQAENQPSESTLRLRQMMKAYLAAPIATRHLAAREAWAAPLSQPQEETKT